MTPLLWLAIFATPVLLISTAWFYLEVRKDEKEMEENYRRKVAAGEISEQDDLDSL